MKEQAKALPSGTILQSSAFTYTIERVLGAGTFGITYLASTLVKVKTVVSGGLGDLVQEKDESIQVCIKEFFMRELNSRDENTYLVDGSWSSMSRSYRDKFRKEALNISKFNHENIVKVLEVFDANNTTYYAMEYIDGQNLDGYIPNGGVSETAALRIIKEIAKALIYLHSHQVLHLDLKPKNVMLDKNGNVKLIDFGLSKHFDINGMPESSTSIGLGTPGYAPIEQANYVKGNGFPATLDIYALGATLYKLLTGKRPPLATEVLENGLGSPPNKVTEETWHLVEWSMQPKRKDRPQSVEQLFPYLDIDNSGNSNTEEGRGLSEKTAKCPSKPETHLGLAILSTVFCMPIGIVAIVNAAKVDSLYFDKDYEGAQMMSEKAKKWAFISFLIFGIILALWIIFMIIWANLNFYYYYY